MEDKNEPCLVLQFNPKSNNIIGIDLTTTYNYWEKEAFIDMNRKQLFPYKVNGTRFVNFEVWFNNILMCPIKDDIETIFKKIKDILPRVIYPGYD